VGIIISVIFETNFSSSTSYFPYRHTRAYRLLHINKWKIWKYI